MNMISTEMIERERWCDNPNPKARIAFVICYPFQYYVYKNIYRHLDDAEFVVDFGVFFPVHQPHALERDIISFLQRKGVYYRILYYSDYFFGEYLRKFFEQYSTLVGVWERGCHLLVCNRNKKQVSLTYGAGKELTQVRFSRRYNDLILAFGSRDVQLFSLFTEAKIVGNPKFDDWFNDELDQGFLSEIRDQLVPGKPTILYLPTHGDLSSLEILTDELCRLIGEFNVIAKIHYFLLRENAEQVDRLRGKGVTIMEDDADLLPLLKLCDVVLSDNSSAIFDAILADKPIVVTDFLSKEYLDVEHKTVQNYKRGKSIALTYSGSIEQVIKHDGSMIVIRNPEEIGSAVLEAIRDSAFCRKRRKEIREMIFSFNDGRSGMRAAEEIRRLSRTVVLRDRPILFHAVESFVDWFKKSPFTYLRKEEKLLEYERALFGSSERSGSEIRFSIIIIDEMQDGFGMTVRSACEQRFPGEAYEIIVVTSRSFSDCEAALEKSGMKNDNVSRIRFSVFSGGLSLGQGIASAVRLARGERICFTKIGYLLPSHWLARFLLAYERFPDAGGIGGHTVQLRKIDLSIFNIFENIETGRLLGFLKEPSDFYEVKNRVLRRNPAGRFSNMSYRTDIVMDALDIFERNSVDVMEIELKLFTLRRYDLCFIPEPVKRIGVTTFSSFVRENFGMGIALSDICYLHAEVAWYYRPTLFMCIRVPFLSVLGDNRFRKTFQAMAVLFLGYSCRLVGKYYWMFLRVFKLGRLLRRLQDMGKHEKVV